MTPDGPKTWPVKRTESYGGIVVDARGPDPSVALIRPRTEDGREVWALPKGAKDEGEAPEDAALREVREETGLLAEVVEPMEPITYWFVWAPERVRYRKTVHFFLMRLTGGGATPDGVEVAEVALVPLERAHTKATYPSEKKVLKDAAHRVASW